MFAIERCLDNTGKKSQRVHKLGLHLFWVPFYVSMLNSNRLKPFFKPNTLWSNRHVNSQRFHELELDLFRVLFIQDFGLYIQGSI